MKTMAKEQQMGITVTKEENMPEWYEQVILKSGLADHAPVKGCMIIKPLGYGVWQNIMDYFNTRLAVHDVKNCYFPMFIPEHFFHKEASHAEGFKAEVAWVEPRGEDKARYAIRPTSETIIYDAFSTWIRSWRDLPMRVNQWCNICRWEVQDCKLFLRSREFLWQEGHCAYTTEEECEKETLAYLEEYRKLIEEQLAIPVLKGRKTEKEKFAGAKHTYTVESLMPDGKGLQVGTSHNLGLGFGKAFGISFLGTDEKQHTPWQNSWGVSTRLIGALVMTHSDNKGLVLPPRIAPLQVVIVPILFDNSKEQVLAAAHKIASQLSPLRVQLDERVEYNPGWKYNEWEVKGVPLRIEIGPKDLEKNQCVLVRRDSGAKETVSLSSAASTVQQTLEKMQHDLFTRAKERLDSQIVTATTKDAFFEALQNKKIVRVSFCGDAAIEQEIKEKTTGATSRCIPLDKNQKPAKPTHATCFYTGKTAEYDVYFAKNY